MPRVSVSHGRRSISEWTDVHRLNDGPTRARTIERCLRHVWCSSDRELVGCYTVPKMAHGTRSRRATMSANTGVPNLLARVGISSSYPIAKFGGPMRLSKKFLRQSVAAQCPRLTKPTIRMGRPLRTGAGISKGRHSRYARHDAIISISIVGPSWRTDWKHATAKGDEGSRPA